MFINSSMTKFVTFLIALVFSQSLFAALSDDFVIQVKTDNSGSSSDIQFTIPTTGSGYNYAVDCDNDGGSEARGVTGDYTCNYPVAGTYTIRIHHNNATGNGFPRIYFNNTGDRLKIISIDQWGTGHWLSMFRAFWGAANMVTPAIDNPNLSSVASMDLSYMFFGAASVNPNTTNWNTSTTTNISSMFRDATSANPNTSNWDTSKVTNMNNIFHGATSANPDTSGWVTGLVTDMKWMFAFTDSANPDVSDWDTSKVESMWGMFRDNSIANPDTSQWDTSSVTEMGDMFIRTISANPDTSSWDISKVESMSYYFWEVTIPTVDYDAMLIGFNNQSLQSNVNFHGGFSQYCSPLAQAARANLISTYAWNLDDGGLCAPSFVPDLTPNTDSGISQSDNITNNNTPEFIIHCSVIGNTLRLYSDKPSVNTLIATHECTSAGNEAVAVGVSMVNGIQNITYTDEPLYDTASGHSSPLIITIDDISPNAPNCSTSPNPAINGTSVVTTCSSVEVGSTLAINNMTCLAPTGITGNVACSGVVGTGVDQISVADDMVTVTDAAGNSNTSETTGLQIDNTPAINDFVITVNTNNSGTSSNTQFIVPIYGAGYNYNVDCNNDGIKEAFAQSGYYTCDYSAMGLPAGIYTIRIEDNTGLNTGFPRIYFNNVGDKLKIISLDQWGTGHWSSMERAFYGAENMLTPATDVPNLTSVPSMNLSYMFYFAGMANPNTSNWNTMSVSNMSYLFGDAISANPNTSNWVTSNVTTMSNMFNNAIVANPDTSGWNTSMVTDMGFMFGKAISASPDTSGWNTELVTNMKGMFYRATSANPNTSNWDTSSVTDMSHMFREANTNPNTSMWDTSEVTTLASMFYNNQQANPNTSNWDTSKVDNMFAVFESATNANPDVSEWDTSKVTDISVIFYNATSASPDTSSWDTSSVTDMHFMFKNAISANPDTSSWDVTQVTTMFHMFHGVTLPTVDYDAILIGFNNQILQNGVSFHGGNSQYCSVAAQSARANMISSDNWVIIDGNLCDIPLAPIMAPDLLSLSDTGIDDSDNITQDNTPEFDVKCSVIDNTITLYSNNPIVNTAIGTHICMSTSTESILTVLPNGVHDVTYTYTNGAGESPHSPVLIVNVDNTIPITPNCATLPNPAKNGVSVTTTCHSVEVGSRLTIDNMACPAPTGVTGIVACSGIVGTGVGQISVTDDRVTVTDAAGNSNTDATTGLLIDNIAPIGPGLLMAPDNLTNDINDDIIGSCGSDAANGTVVVTSLPVGGFTQLYGVEMSLDNNGEFVIGNPIWSEGLYELTFECADEAGNGPSIFGLFGPIEIDLTIDTPIINPIATTYLEITGSAEPHATLDFSNANCINFPIIVDQNGSWSCNLSVGLEEGVIVTVVATDLAGNESAIAISTVLAVNVAPSFDVYCDIDATDVTVGKNRTIDFPGFIYNMLVGPANESEQTYDLQLTTVSNGDPDLIIDSMDLLHTGDLALNINVNNSGVATVEITMVDNGGTQVGGVDTTIIQFNIHNYADLNLDPRYSDLDLNDIVYKNTFDSCR